MSFNTITLKAAGLPDVTFDANSQGGVTVRSANYRILTINPAGGHWEASAPGGVSPDAKFTLDAGNHIVVTLE